MARKKKAASEPESKEETALATTEKPQVARSAEEIDKEWVSKVEELRTRKLTLAHDTLQFYYDVGLLATELTNSAAQDPAYRKYGSHTSDELMVQLGLGRSTFYAALQFVAFVDEETLQRMKAKMMPWSAVQVWLTVKEKKDRDKILSAMEKGKIKTRKEIRGAVKTANGNGTEKPSTSKASGMTLALSQVKSFNTTATQAESRALPGLVEALKLYKKGGEDASDTVQEKFEAELKEVKKHLTTIARLLDTAQKALEAAGA